MMKKSESEYTLLRAAEFQSSYTGNKILFVSRHQTLFYVDGTMNLISVCTNFKDMYRKVIAQRIITFAYSENLELIFALQYDSQEFLVIQPWKMKVLGRYPLGNTLKELNIAIDNYNIVKTSGNSWSVIVATKDLTNPSNSKFYVANMSRRRLCHMNFKRRDQKVTKCHSSDRKNCIVVVYTDFVEVYDSRSYKLLRNSDFQRRKSWSNTFLCEASLSLIYEDKWSNGLAVKDLKSGKESNMASSISFKGLWPVYEAFWKKKIVCTYGTARILILDQRGWKLLREIRIKEEIVSLDLAFLDMHTVTLGIVDSYHKDMVTYKRVRMLKL